MVQADIFFCVPCFLFVFVVLVAVADAFNDIAKQEGKEPMPVELPYMRQFVPQPFLIVEDFRLSSIVQQYGPAQYHRHFILF